MFQSCKQLAELTYILHGRYASDEQIHNLAIYSVEKNNKTLKYTTCTTESFPSVFKQANNEAYDHDPQTIVINDKFEEYSSFLLYYIKQIFFKSWRIVFFCHNQNRS